MDLAALVGARLAVGCPHAEATDEVIDRLRRLRARSLVIFERNAPSVERFVEWLHRLEAALEERFLVLVDHEGGRIVRFAQGVTRFPDALTVGRTRDAETVERQGRIEAEELRRLGVQVNLAPCLDVLTAGCDPVIGDRSYGPDPARVSALGVARIRGLQAHGVAACAKHFPGLGAVPRDPHRVLPTIPVDRATLERVHLEPFRAAIACGVAMVMSSHVCYPALGDPEGLPATCSRRLIRGLLRETMGFAGPIVTDDLDMGALRPLGSVGEAAVRAAEAGHDLLLICSDLAAAQEAAEAMRDAYRSGRLEMADLTASVERLERLRQILGLPPCR